MGPGGSSPFLLLCWLPPVFGTFPSQSRPHGAALPPVLFLILPSVPFSKTPALSSQAGKQRGGPLLGTGDPQTTSILLAYFMEKMGKCGEEIPSKSRFFSQPTNLPCSVSANLLPDRWSGKRVPPVRLTLTPPLVSASDPLSVLPSPLSPGSSACLCHSQHIHSPTVSF